jgi:hypothetical protein
MIESFISGFTGFFTAGMAIIGFMAGLVSLVFGISLLAHAIAFIYKKTTKSIDD